MTDRPQTPEGGETLEAGPPPSGAFVLRVKERVQAMGLCGDVSTNSRGEEVMCILSSPCDLHSPAPGPPESPRQRVENVVAEHERDGGRWIVGGEIETRDLRAILDELRAFVPDRSPAPEGAVEALREALGRCEHERNGRDHSFAQRTLALVAEAIRALSAPRVEAERVGTLTVEGDPSGDFGWAYIDDGGASGNAAAVSRLPPGTYEIRPLPAPPETKDDE